jgi:catechol 2,3-dioxygenase-like lactoylglutathione lyase family enzyme
MADGTDAGVSTSSSGTANSGTANIGTASIGTASIGTASIGTASIGTASIGKVRVTGLDHIVLISADVERALRFWCGQLGLEGVRVEAWRQGEVPFPSVRISPTTIIDLFPGQPSGQNLEHVCLTIEPTNLQALADSDEFTVVRGPIEHLFGAQGYATSLYVADPDGTTVELRSY